MLDGPRTSKCGDGMMLVGVAQFGAVWCLESGAAALPIRVHCDINMWLKVTVKYPTPNLNKWLKIYIWQWRPNTYINGNISYSTNKLYLVYL